jgi:hypothetical protein
VTGTLPRYGLQDILWVDGTVLAEFVVDREWRVSIGLTHGVVTHLSIEPATEVPPGGLTVRGIRNLPIGKMENLARRAAASQLRGTVQATIEADLRRVDPNYTPPNPFDRVHFFDDDGKPVDPVTEKEYQRMLERRLAPEIKRAREARAREAALEADMLQPRKPGPPRISGRDLALVARVYAEIGLPTGKPLEVVRQNLDLPNVEAARYRVKLARKNGLLTGVKKGKQGGEVTDKARALLEEGDS